MPQRPIGSNRLFAVAKNQPSGEVNDAVESGAGASGPKAHWLSTALKSAPDGIIVVDLTGRVLYLNPVAEHLTGWAADEALGHDLLEVLPFQQNRENLRGDLVRLATLSEGALGLGKGLTLCSRSGREREIEAEIAASEGSDSAVVTFRDVTQRRWEEQQRQEEQAIRAVERLAGTAAHTFSNSLTTIMGHCDLLLHGELGGELRASLTEINHAAIAAAEVARQLSTLTRQQTICRQELNLNTVVEEYLPALSRVLPASIELTTTLEPALRRINADRNQLEQLLYHLVMNAHDALPSGGRIAITTRNILVDVNERFGRAQTFVSVTVADNGPGIRPDISDRIFEPFFTTKKEAGRVGLGLPIVQGIVRDYRGYLNVQSAPGSGTKIEFVLPSVEKDPFPYLGCISNEEDRAATKTILLVEDDHAIRLLVRKILERCEYEVLEAQDGEAALLIAELQQGSIDLMITDIIMPGMNGYDLVARFVPLHPETKILFISGCADVNIPDAVRSMFKEIECLHKPFKQRALIDHVQRLLGVVPNSP